jgi:head-tail adaptor
MSFRTMLNEVCNVQRKGIVYTVTLASVVAGNTAVINGMTFTGAAAESKYARQFSISGNDTADAASLVACINDASKGVPGLVATSSGAIVTLTPLTSAFPILTMLASPTMKLSNLDARGKNLWAWVPHITAMKCRLQGVSGKELDQQVQGQQRTHKIYALYDADLRAADRIVQGTRYFDIKYVDPNVAGQRLMVEAQLVEVAA